MVRSTSGDGRRIFLVLVLLLVCVFSTVSWIRSNPASATPTPNRHAAVTFTHDRHAANVSSEYDASILSAYYNKSFHLGEDSRSITGDSANNPTNHSASATHGAVIANEVDVDGSSIKNGTNAGQPHCKTLWLAGFWDGGPKIEGYAKFYSSALLSSKHSAPGLFQPVLLVGHLEENRTNVPLKVQRVKDSFYQWAQDEGALVIHREKLAFQDVVNQYYSEHGPKHRQGPFFRLDIPNIIQEHQLLSREGVCKHNDVVLYTDCDVLFINVTASSLEEAKGIVDGHNGAAIVAYGPQQDKVNKPWNTGVMFLSATGFGSRMDSILEFGRQRSFKFISFDQGLLNAYFGMKRSLRVVLPWEWNYKAYWGNPLKRDMPRIMHFHGPKPDGRTLDCLASMDPSCIGNTHPYEKFIRQGFSADGGLLANETLRAFYRYASNYTWESIAS